MPGKDPRAMSAKWRCEIALALYRKRVIVWTEAANRLIAEGFSHKQAFVLLGAVDIGIQRRRDHRNARRRELYAQRKASKE